MDGLTEHRPIASLPFGGKYRLIDFPLSNLANAGIRSVFGIFQNENISSVFDHIRSGREWGLSTLLSHYYLGIYNTPVESSTVDKEYYSQILTYLKRSGSDQTVALNSDVLVNIDLNQVLHLHNSTRQKITVVYKKLPKEQISDVNSVLEIDESDKVLSHELFQGGDKEAYNMSTDIFVVDTPYLIEKLEEEAAKEEPRKLRYVLRDLAVSENGFAYEYIVVTYRMNVNLAAWEECLNTEYINNHTTFSATLDVTLNDFLILERFVNLVPALVQTGLAVRKNQLAFLVFLVFYVNLNLVTDLQIWIVTEFRSRNDTIALVTDVNNHFFLVERDNSTLYNLMLLNLVQGFVISLFKVLLADVCA